MVFFVNRRNRKRHTTEECRALELTRLYLDAERELGQYERLPDDEIPTYETRVVRIETNDPDELAAVEAFTIPCQWCVPGARDLVRLRLVALSAMARSVLTAGSPPLPVSGRETRGDHRRLVDRHVERLVEVAP